MKGTSRRESCFYKLSEKNLLYGGPVHDIWYILDFMFKIEVIRYRLLMTGEDFSFFKMKMTTMRKNPPLKQDVPKFYWVFFFAMSEKKNTIISKARKEPKSALKNFLLCETGAPSRNNYFLKPLYCRCHGEYILYTERL